MTKRVRDVLLSVLVLLPVLYFPLFSNLGELPFRKWDEARVLQNTLEMSFSDNFIITTYNGQPEFWNTKPPLLNWLQILAVEIMGSSEFAFRFPSAFAGLLTCLIVFYIGYKVFNSIWAGVFAALVLLTTGGYVAMHSTRTADYDALLTMFTTGAVLAFYCFMERSKKSLLYLVFICLTLAVLTKGVAGLLFTPALLVYALIYKRALGVLKSPHFYLGLAGSIIIVFGYYLLRESYQPGYLNAVYQNELWGRYSETIENQNPGHFFYFEVLLKEMFGSWIVAGLSGVYLGLKYGNNNIRRLTTLLTTSVAFYLLVISVSQTKVPWYIVPVYPLLAILSAVALYTLLSKIKDSLSKGSYNATVAVTWIFFLILFFQPYVNAMDRSLFPKEKPKELDQYTTSYLLQDAYHKQLDLSGTKVVWDGYDGHVRLYVKLLRSQGQDIQLTELAGIKPGDQVITGQQSIEDQLSDKYQVQIMSENGPVKIFKVTSTK